MRRGSKGARTMWIIRYPLSPLRQNRTWPTAISASTRIRPRRSHPPPSTSLPLYETAGFHALVSLCAIPLRLFFALVPFSTLSFRSISTVAVVTAASCADSLRFDSREFVSSSEFRTRARNNRIASLGNQNKVSRLD